MGPFAAILRFPRFDALALSPTGASLTTGGTHTVTAASVAEDGAPAPGVDTLTAFADVDGDGTRDPHEAQEFVTAQWTSPPVKTIDDLDDPAPFREVNVEPLAGEVYVRLPGGSARSSQLGAPAGFVPLHEAAQIPIGSQLDTTRGRVLVESAAAQRRGRTQRAQFYAGRFQIRQPRSARPITEIVNKGGGFRTCPRSKARASGDARADVSQRRRRGRRVRRLWGDGSGRFRTRGRYSSATVRGTKWVVEDHCNGTLTRVARRPRTNRVVVRDFVRRRSVILRAGQSYFAARR